MGTNKNMEFIRRRVTKTRNIKPGNFIINFIKAAALSFLLLPLSVSAANDPEISTVLQGAPVPSNSLPIAVNMVCDVQDPIYYNTTDRQRIADITKDKYKNVIALFIDETSQQFIPNDFTYAITLNITYYDLNENAHTINGVTLAVSYTKAAGLKYDARQYYYLADARKVTVTITNAPDPAAGAWDPRKVLLLKNSLIATRDYKFEQLTATFDTKTAQPDELNIKWLYDDTKGATHFDVEWAWIDAESIENYKSLINNILQPDARLIFRRNATRITITKNIKEYNIPLLYDGEGFLYYRIRPVQYRENGDIIEGTWNVVLGTSSNDYYSFTGHENNQFNWQSSTSFAEDGKRKTVVQYFDGTLRSRQTVTKDNSTPDKNTVVAETYYDYQGRPAINILPAPTLNTVLSYARNFNKFTGQTAAIYPKDIYDQLQTGQNICSSVPVPLDNTQGTSQYYSPNNTAALTSADNFNKFIPDAQGFPYTETRYTPDATGRIAEQSGVGPDHKLNSGHQTKYYYGSPSQTELDGIFGMEVGYASHYFKNMVVDANRQVSVSYTDMHGRTVATALAGDVPANLTALPSQGPAIQVMEKDLLTTENNVVQGRSVVSTSTLLVEKEGLHTFQYTLDPLSATVAACNPPGDVCYSCYYDLTIKISDACGNIVAEENRTNLSFINNALDVTCTPQGIAVTIPNVVIPNLTLAIGEYNVTKILTVNKSAQDWYRENVFRTKSICKSIETIRAEVLATLLFEITCSNMTCASCTAAVGATPAIYHAKYLTALGLPPNAVLTAEQEADITASYKLAIEHCSTLCNKKETALDMIEQQMLHDMTPGMGQYARTNMEDGGTGGEGTDEGVYENGMDRPFNVLKKEAYPVTSHISSSASVPYYKTPVDEEGTKSIYKNSTGAIDPQAYELNGDVLNNVDEFTGKFTDEWAKALLYYHPEYPKLKYAKEHLKTSYEFDLSLDDVETWDMANSLGYITALMSHDPYFTGTGAAGAGDAAEMLSNMNTAYNGGPGFWKLAYLSIACMNRATGSDAAACVDEAPDYPSGPNWSNLTGRCTADKNYMWKIFKTLYLTIKNNMISTRLDGQMNAAVYPSLKTNNYQRRFGTVTELLDGYAVVKDIIATAGGSAGAAIQTEYEHSCHSYIQFWKNELAPCNLPVAVMDEIIAKLENICVQGSDPNHPLGSASVKPSSPNSYPYQRFEDAIKAILELHNIPVTAVCHPFMVSYPRPYEHQPPLNEGIVINSKDKCLCDNLERIKQKMIVLGYNVSAANLAGNMHTYINAQYKIDIAATLLQTLLDGCAGTGTCTTYNPPLAVPGFLTSCNTSIGENCLDCEQYRALKYEFITNYNGLFSNVLYANPSTTDEFQQNEAFAAFMNNKTGFNKTWFEYVGFDTLCPLALKTAEGNIPSAQAPPALCGMIEPHRIPPSDPEGPCDFINDMALRIATERYKAYETSQYNLFDNTYLTKCLEARNHERLTVTAEVAQYHYTLYYYDQAGNLVKTVPPQGVHPDFTPAFIAKVKADRIAGAAIVYTPVGNTIANVPAHAKVTQYRYNSLNQVVAQISPDGGVSHFWYDRLGRLVVSQNAKQKAANKYSYTLYDALGRIKEVGQKPNAVAMTQSISQSESGLNAWIYNNNLNKEQVTRTTYDVLAVNVNPPPPVAPITQQNLRNRVSFSQVFDYDPDAGVANPGDPNYNDFASATYYSYDIHGNVDVLLQDYKQLLSNFGGNRFKIIKYQYDLISGKVNEVAYQPGSIDQFYHRYEYDAENKLTEVNTSRDGLYWERDAEYKYYRHGPLARTELGKLQVQGIDYAYTIQGWLKGVNSTAITGTTDIGKDGLLFGTSGHNPVARDAYSFSLNYFNSANGGDYKPISNIGAFAGILPAGGGSLQAAASDGLDVANSLFNGNIAAMSVNIPKLGNAKIYGYKYDQLNRIVRMNTYTGFDNAANSFNPISVTEDYKERVSYDADGNILSYLRNGDANRPNAMDNMQYSYKADNNQLDKVVDNAPDVAANIYDKYNDIKQEQNDGNYEYDEIGNLVKDVSEDIISIEWSVYGKIKEIIKGQGQDLGSQIRINYTYDVSGNRISKSVQQGTASRQTTIYVRDASGNVMSVYGQINFEAALNPILKQSEVHLYGSSRLGMINTDIDVSDGNALAVPAERSTTFTRGNKLFELSNHLGNVLVTISDKKLLVVSEGSECIGGTAPGIMNIYARTTSQLTYVARQEINFWPNFESRPDDEFTAYIDPNLQPCIPPDNIPDGSYFAADVITANDYYPFGMQMPGRKYPAQNNGYRYGFNGQERSDELNENLTTALYWEYDSRIARRWNIDPVFKSGISGYSVLGNNPIIMVDPFGNDWYRDTKGKNKGDIVFMQGNGKHNGYENITGSWTKRNSRGFSYLYGHGKEDILQSGPNDLLKGVTVIGKGPTRSLASFGLAWANSAVTPQAKAEVANQSQYNYKRNNGFSHEDAMQGLPQDNSMKYGNYWKRDQDGKNFTLGFVGITFAPLAAYAFAESGAAYYLAQGGEYLSDAGLWALRKYGRSFAINTFKNYVAQRGQIGKMDWYDIAISTVSPFKKGVAGNLGNEFLKSAFDFKDGVATTVFNRTKSFSDFTTDLIYGGFKVGTKDAFGSAFGSSEGRDFMIDILYDQNKFDAKQVVNILLNR